MTTILAFGDIHIKPDNAIEVDLLQRQLIKYLDKIQPTFVVILGDILDTHERILSNCLNRAYELFKVIKDRAELFILVGNHDQYNNKQFLTENHWMNTMKEWKGKITIVDKVISRKINGDIFTFVPYVESGRFIEALDTNDPDNNRPDGWWKKSLIIFAHQEFKGCNMNDKISTNGDIWNKKYPQIISGHIHSSQTLGNVYYPGSILQTAFGEKSNSILLQVKINKEDIELTEIKLDLPRQETIELNSEDVENYDFEKVIKSKNIGKLRLIVVGSIEEFVTFKNSDKYKELIKSGVKIIFSKKHEERKKIENYQKSLMSVFKQIIKEDKELMKLYEEIIEVQTP